MAKIVKKLPKKVLNWYKKIFCTTFHYIEFCPCPCHLTMKSCIDCSKPNPWEEDIDKSAVSILKNIPKGLSEDDIKYTDPF